MALIVSNAELLSDDLGHAAACPDLATKTVGLRPMRKEVRNQPKLLRFKLRMAAVGQMRQQCRTSSRRARVIQRLIVLSRTPRATAMCRCFQPRALFVSPLFFGAAGGFRKALTPDILRFPWVFHHFTSQSHENHDFYPTPPLHGVSIAMYTSSLVKEPSRPCGSPSHSLCLLGQRSRILPPWRRSAVVWRLSPTPPFCRDCGRRGGMDETTIQSPSSGASPH